MIRSTYALALLGTLGALATAGHSADTTLAGYEVVDGFVEDGGTAFLLYRRGPVSSASSVLVRVGSDGTIADSIELPEVWGKSLRRHASGGLLLWSLKGPRDRDGYGVLVREVVELRRNGQLRQVWEWNSDRYPTWLDVHAFSFPGDGRVWGVAAPGLRRREQGALMYGGLEIALGDFRKRQAKVARTLSVRFEEPQEVRKWAAEEWGGWVILESRGPVLAVSWRGREFVVHCGKRECRHRMPLFRREEERLSFWHLRDKIMWSSTPKAWRAYHLWDLGLAAGGDEPIWEVERSNGWQPHPERGLVRVLRREGEYRIEHLWRDPWTSREELHVSEWQDGSSPRGGYTPDLLVSASGGHAMVFGSRVLEEGDLSVHVRKLDLRFEPLPLPPVEAVAVDTDSGAAPSDKLPDG